MRRKVKGRERIKKGRKRKGNGRERRAGGSEGGSEKSVKVASSASGQMERCSMC